MSSRATRVLPLAVPNITVYVTNRCNLKCDYCFQAGRDSGRMTPETGRQTLDWFIRSASGAATELVCTFFGGEPLLEFDLIRKLVDYGDKKAARAGKKIRFGATTNGTLFTRKMQEFWREHKMSILLSVDGGEAAQNLHRKTARGGGSFELLERAIPLIREVLPSATARLTVTPQTMPYLMDSVRFLAETKGFTSVAPYPVEQGWNREFRKVANWFLERAQAGHYVEVESIVNNIRKLTANKKVTRAVLPCGVGKGYLAVSVDGGIYPCHRFVSSNDFRGAFRLGDVWKSVEPRLQAPFLRLTSKNVLGCRVPCEDCEANPICGGGCLAQNHEVCGNMLFPIPDQQHISTMYYDIARQVLAVLRDRAPDILQKHVTPRPGPTGRQPPDEDPLKC